MGGIRGVKIALIPGCAIFFSRMELEMKTIEIVIRPSAVWNSRSPFNEYTKSDRLNTRYRSISIASLLHTEKLIKLQDGEARAVDYFKRSKLGFETTGSIAEFFTRYHKSFGKIENKLVFDPKLSDVAEDLRRSINYVNQMSCVRAMGIFESFLQSWFLNDVLADLEMNQEISEKRAELCERFNPLLFDKVPSARAIINASDLGADFLSELSPYKDGSKIDPNIDNCKEHLNFWFEFRNLVIHRDGFCTSAFFDRFGKVYDMIRTKIKLGRGLQPKQPLPMDNQLYFAQSDTLRVICLKLNEKLKKKSLLRRGHPHAPGPEVKFIGNVYSPPLLMEGDHVASVNYVKSDEYRNRIGEIFSRSKRRRI